MIDPGSTPPRHHIERVRHELKRRLLTIGRIETVTPRMRRIHVTSPELEDFRSLSPDDHVKIVLPAADGSTDQPVMRDLTPRRFDRAGQTLALDVALHEAGPVTRWAETAQVGDRVEIGGPRGSLVVPDDFDWYLLIGDETALPAIGRRVEELRADVPVLTAATVFDRDEAQTFATRAAWTPTWVFRGAPTPADADRLREAVAGLTLPTGEGYVWIAGELTIARSLRALFLERGHPREWMRAAAYWQRGAADAHAALDD